MANVYRNERSGTAARAAAGARPLHGRRPHLLHPGPGGGRDLPLPRPGGPAGAPDVRVRARFRGLDPARRSGWATTRPGNGPRRCSSAALDRKGIAYRIDEGGGAFYGPKIDIKFRDAIGRLWQGPTIQLDFNLPERFELEYTGADNKPHRPVMIHRAIYGTLERFIGNLIEHFAGAFPVWLAPEQVRVIPISDARPMPPGSWPAGSRPAGIRVHVDDRNETLNYRIREGEVQKVPYMAVVGQREAESDSLALRVRGAGKKQEVMPVDAFLERVERGGRTRKWPAGSGSAASRRAPYLGGRRHRCWQPYRSGRRSTNSTSRVILPQPNPNRISTL